MFSISTFEITDKLVEEITFISFSKFCSVLDKVELEQMKLQISNQIDTDWELAMQDPQAETSSLLSDVYKR